MIPVTNATRLTVSWLATDDQMQFFQVPGSTPGSSCVPAFAAARLEDTDVAVTRDVLKDEVEERLEEILFGSQPFHPVASPSTDSDSETEVNLYLSTSSDFIGRRGWARAKILYVTSLATVGFFYFTSLCFGFLEWR